MKTKSYACVGGPMSGHVVNGRRTVKVYVKARYVVFSVRKLGEYTYAEAYYVFTKKKAADYGEWTYLKYIKDPTRGR